MLSPEDQHEYLRRGLACLRKGDFFAAHEEWEIPWKDKSGAARSFWQAMIQLSVGAYHYQRRNLTGCRNMWNKALKRCDDILAENLAGEARFAKELKSILANSLQRIETNENPLPDIQHFAREIVNEDWLR
jgi:predicted metal-dependent hydrolase